MENTVTLLSLIADSINPLGDISFDLIGEYTLAAEEKDCLSRVEEREESAVGEARKKLMAKIIAKQMKATLSNLATEFSIRVSEREGRAKNDSGMKGSACKLKL